MIPSLPVPNIKLTESELRRLETENGDRLLEYVRNHNLTTHSSDLERIPELDRLTRQGRQMGLTNAESAGMVWILGRSLKLLPVRLTVDEPAKMGYVHNDRTTRKLVSTVFTEKMQTLFSSIDRRVLSPPQIRTLFEKEPWKIPQSGNDAIAFQGFFAGYCDLIDYLELFSRDPEMLSNEAMTTRLEENRRRLRERCLPGTQATAPLTPATALPDHPPLPAGTPGKQSQTAATGVTTRRAVDRPEWKSFAGKHQGTIPWPMVIKEFGATMMINIILRRQDYRALLGLIVDGELSQTQDLVHLSRSMQKIKENSDVGPNVEDFQSLQNFVAGRLMGNGGA